MTAWPLHGEDHSVKGFGTKPAPIDMVQTCDRVTSVRIVSSKANGHGFEEPRRLR